MDWYKRRFTIGEIIELKNKDENIEVLRSDGYHVEVMGGIKRESAENAE